MQITIKIDVSEGYDRLSVLEIKKSKSPPLQQQILQKQIQELETQISNSIGAKLSKQIYHSPEYKELYEINKEIFLTIDRCKTQELSAKIIDNLNFKRFLAKNNLQQKYFNKKSEEIKIGYNG